MERLSLAGFWPAVGRSVWAALALVLGLVLFATPASAQLRSGYVHPGGASTPSSISLTTPAPVGYVGNNFTFTSTLTSASSCPCGAMKIYARPAGASGPITQIAATPANNFVGSAASGTWTPSGAGTFEVWAEFQPTGVNIPSETGLFTVVVLAAPPGTPAVTPATLPTPVIGVGYSQTVTAVGGTGPYNYVLAGGSLPAGLSLGSGGTISGTPTTPGAYSFTIQATDSLLASGSTTYTGTIAPLPVTVVVSPGSLPAGTLTVP